MSSTIVRGRIAAFRDAPWRAVTRSREVTCSDISGGLGEFVIMCLADIAEEEANHEFIYDRGDKA